MKYSKQWTHFEVQSLAFGILRKHLFPTYLVRGNYKFPTVRADIAIFKNHPSQEPELKLVIKVEPTNVSLDCSEGVSWSRELGVPHVYIRSGTEAYKCLDFIRPLLD